VSENSILVPRLIEFVKQHKKPSSPKSITVLVKLMDDKILNPGNHSVEKFKRELKAALASDVVWSETIRQQHSEEELRSLFANLLESLES
jgi:hypothetical protein